MNCLNCNNEIENNSSRTKKFCEDACRKSYSRRTDDVGQFKSDIPEQSKVIEGYCHGCGKKHIDIKENWVNPPGNEKAANLMCICHPCVRKGVTHKSLGLKMCDG